MSDKSDGGTYRPEDGDTLYVDDERGLWVPPSLREFDRQVVFRTPKGTIQHFGSEPLDAFYALIDESAFGEAGEIRDCRNPELAPNRVSIKPQGDEPLVFEVADVA